VGHELGHNFGSRHTHCTDTNPATSGVTEPIDFCYSGESCTSGPWPAGSSVSCPAPFTIDPVNGAPIASVRGTLMSYCHLLGGCGVTNVFHPQSVDVIAPIVESRVNSCIFPVLHPAPSVTQISPTLGSTSGGTPVTITGSSFRSPAGVAFVDRSDSVSATSVVVVSPTQITAVTPAAGAGLRDLVVFNPDQQTGVKRDAFTFSAAPSVTSVNPNGGPTSGGTSVTIGGSGFQTAVAATVTIGGAAATAVVVASASQITAVTPPHAAGAVDVVVTQAGLSGLLAGAFLYSLPEPAADYHTLTPCRLVDTRSGAGGILAPGTTRSFTVAGPASACGVPATAKAVALNVTAVTAAAAGYLALYAGDALAPTTSTVNFAAGQTRGNNAVIRVASNGSGTLAVKNGSSGATHVVLDVVGYFE
jgi:hypothetical protein